MGSTWNLRFGGMAPRTSGGRVSDGTRRSFRWRSSPRRRHPVGTSREIALQSPAAGMENQRLIARFGADEKLCQRSKRLDDHQNHDENHQNRRNFVPDAVEPGGLGVQIPLEILAPARVEVV